MQGLEQRISALLLESVADMLALESEAGTAAAAAASLSTRLQCASAAADSWAGLQRLQDGSDGPPAEAAGVTVFSK